MSRAGRRIQGNGWRRLPQFGMLLAALLLALTAGAPASALPELCPSAEVAPAAELSAAESVPVNMPEAPVENLPPAGPVPESEPVAEGYFADTVFLGDSRTEGLFLYGSLQEASYLYAVGATVESVFTKATQETETGKVPLLDALGTMDCGKVYMMLGVNELGWSRSENFYDQYAKLIDRVRADHPDAEVVLQSILPVSAKQEAKGSYVNNERIAEYNRLVETLAAEKACPYLDVAAAVTDEDGCLRPELTNDGIHLNVAGCREWETYLETHAIT